MAVSRRVPLNIARRPKLSSISSSRCRGISDMKYDDKTFIRSRLLRVVL